MREVTTFEAHDNYVLALAFTASGDTLISSSMDNSIKLWSTNDWRELATFAGHNHSANSLSLSPDGTLLASGSSDQTVRLWSFPGGEPLHVLQDRKQTVAGVAFSPNGEWIAAPSYGGRVPIWDRDGNLVVGIRATKKNLNSAAFAPDGETLAVSGLGDDITLWALPSGEQIGTLSGHETAVWSLAFIDEGRTLVSFGYEQSVKFWDTSPWTETRTVPTPGKGARGVLISPDETRVAINMESRIELRSVADWELQAELPVSTKVVSSLAFSHDGRWLAIGGADRRIRIWEIE